MLDNFFINLIRKNLIKSAICLKKTEKDPSDGVLFKIIVM